MKKNFRRTLIIISAIGLILTASGCGTSAVDNDENEAGLSVDELDKIEDDDLAVKDTSSDSDDSDDENMNESEDSSEEKANETTVTSSGTPEKKSVSASVPVNSGSVSNAAPVTPEVVSIPTNTEVAAEAATECSHDWVAVYREEGHYETVMVDPGAQWPMYETHTCCQHCGFDFTVNGGSSAISDHICPDGTTGACYGGHDVQVGWQVIEPVYEEQWIVEQVLDHYECSKCGARK